MTAYSWSITSKQLTASLTPSQTYSGNLQLEINRSWSPNTFSQNYAAIHLNIANITATNEGSYQCRLSNELSIDMESSTCAVYVKVVMQPHIEDLSLLNPTLPANENITLISMRGTNTTMICRATGRPKPILQWFKDGKPLEKDNSRFVFGYWISLYLCGFNVQLISVSAKIRQTLLLMLYMLMMKAFIHVERTMLLGLIQEKYNSKWSVCSLLLTTYLNSMHKILNFRLHELGANKLNAKNKQLKRETKK